MKINLKQILTDLLMLVFLFNGIEAKASGAQCSKVFETLKPEAIANSSNKSIKKFPPEILIKIQKTRPDIFAAIKSREQKFLISRNELVEKEFYREKLEKFDNVGDPFEPVTLFRGLDSETISLDFLGEKGLIWTSEKIEDVLPYALQGFESRLEQVFILKIVVPRFMIYKRSGWPVLRFEEVQNLAPFIEKLAVIPYDKKITTFIYNNPGEEKKLANFIKKYFTGFFTFKHSYWKEPAAVGDYVEN